MAPNSCSFENLHFNPFHNESFSDTEDEREPDETELRMLLSFPK